MEVRIKFSADIYLKGDSMEEIKDKWGGMPLFSEDAKANYAEYNELLLVEDAETNKDLWEEFNNTY